MTFLIRDGFYIPRDKTNLDLVSKHYERKVYKEFACRSCNNLEYRHNYICQTCPSFLGNVKLWRRKLFKGKKFIVVPSGNIQGIRDRLKISGVFKDLRPKISFKNKIKFTGKLYKGQTIDNEEKPDQRKLVKKWLKHKSGLIQSPPRTGKTVLGVYILSKLRVRTLIVASQNLWLKQFVNTLHKFTNASDHKYSYIHVHDRKDLYTSLKYDIVLISYQKFIQLSQQESFNKYIKKKFSLLIIDECHQAAAVAYSKFVNRIHVRYKLGLTATPERTDNLHFIVEDVMGPVISKGNITALLPKIKIWESGIKNPRVYRKWWALERFLFYNDERNDLIINQVFKDLRSNPKASILIAVGQIAHMHELVSKINEKADILFKTNKEEWPEYLAQPFWRGMNREDTFKRIKTYESKVTVAITKMVQFGLDIPQWTHVYCGIKPMSSGPNFYQLASRCCTPYPEKEQPIVRIMIDNAPQSIGCFKKLFITEISQGLKDKEDQPRRYLMGEKDRNLSYKYSYRKKEEQYTL